MDLKSGFWQVKMSQKSRQYTAFFSQTEEDHLHQLRAVFEHFWEHGLKLEPSKCHFLPEEITFLGHRVSAEGMKPRDDRLKGITEMAPPESYTKVWRFLGAT